MTTLAPVRKPLSFWQLRDVHLARAAQATMAAEAARAQADAASRRARRRALLRARVTRRLTAAERSELAQGDVLLAALVALLAGERRS